MGLYDDIKLEVEGQESNAPASSGVGLFDDIKAEVENTQPQPSFMDNVKGFGRKVLRKGKNVINNLNVSNPYENTIKQPVAQNDINTNNNSVPDYDSLFNYKNALNSLGQQNPNEFIQQMDITDTPIQQGYVQKKRFLNDARYWLKTKTRNLGRIINKHIFNSAYKYNPNSGEPEFIGNQSMTNIADIGEMAEYNPNNPYVPAAGTDKDYWALREYEKNPDKYLNKLKIYTQNDYDYIKNMYKKGKISYEQADKLFKQYDQTNENSVNQINNLKRIVEEDAQRKMNGVDVAMAGIDTALWAAMAVSILTGGALDIPTAGGKVVTGIIKNNVKKAFLKNCATHGIEKKLANKLYTDALKKGVIDKGIQLGLENYSKNLLGKYGVDNLATQTLGKMATTGTLSGVAGGIDMSLLNTGIDQYTRYLGINDSNPFIAPVEGFGGGTVVGGALGGVLGGGIPLLAKVPLSTKYSQIPNEIVPYEPKFDSRMGYSNPYENTGFIRYGNVKTNYQASRDNIKPKKSYPTTNVINEPNFIIKETAPNTYAKQQTTIEAKEEARQEQMENLAPNTMAEQKAKAEVKEAQKEAEKRGHHTKDFNKGDIIRDIHSGHIYEVIEPDKRGMGHLRNVDTNEIETLNAHNNAHFEKYVYNPDDLIEVEEFKYDPKENKRANADSKIQQNYMYSKQEVVDAYNEYVKNPTEANREKYEDVSGKALKEYSDNKEAIKNGTFNQHVENTEKGNTNEAVDTSGNTNEAVGNENNTNEPTLQKFSANELKTDAKTFQYKEGGDESGVTEKLKDVKRWNNLSSGKVIVYETKDGTRYIADGHQRLGLAKRLIAEGKEKDVKLDGYLFKEVDGYTPKDIMEIATLKNVAENSGTPLDTAKIIRIRGGVENIPEDIPKNNADFKTGVGLSYLTEYNFARVINEEITPELASEVGNVIRENGEKQKIAIDTILKSGTKTKLEASLVARDILHSDTTQYEQTNLFGTQVVVDSLAPIKAKLVAKAVKDLKGVKGATTNANRNKDILEKADNKINTTNNANLAELSKNGAWVLEERLYSFDKLLNQPINELTKQVSEGLIDEKQAVTKIKELATDKDLLKKSDLSIENNASLSDNIGITNEGNNEQQQSRTRQSSQNVRVDDENQSFRIQGRNTQSESVERGVQPTKTSETTSGRAARRLGAEKSADRQNIAILAKKLGVKGVRQNMKTDTVNAKIREFIKENTKLDDFNVIGLYNTYEEAINASHSVLFKDDNPAKAKIISSKKKDAYAVIVPKETTEITDTKLTAEQERQLSDLKAEYERRKDLINKNNYNEEQKQKDLKAAGMEYSAKKREIIQGDSLEYVEGGLTAKELENKKRYLNSNYIGKQVYVNNKTAKIIGNPFGKVKVQFENGEIKTVSKDELKQMPVINKQIALEGMEKQSAREIQRQQDEVTAKENKELEKPIAEIWKDRWNEVQTNLKILDTDTADDILAKRGILKQNYIQKGHTIGGEKLDAKAEEYLRKMERLDQEMFNEQNKRLKEIPAHPNKVRKNKQKNEPKNKIDDSGEFLRGNRKTNENLTWEDLQKMNEVVREKNLTKAKIYKKPTLDELEAKGLNRYESAIVTYVYNHIGAKAPAMNVEDQKMYVENISLIIDKVVETIKNNPEDFNFDIEKESYYTGKNGWVTKSTNKLFEAIFPNKDNKTGNIFRNYPEYNNLASIMGGNRFVKALQIRRGDTKEIEKIWESFDKTEKTKVKKEDWEKNFTVLEPDKWNNGYRIGLAKSKQIIGDVYQTREEAVEVARKLTEIQAKTKSELKKENFERKHIERRNKDITSDELRETFGFKGVNFGNYVKQKERQDFLNYAYDSLYDLAELLNLPIKALSLNGKLGLAFGAQGHGGKAAGHYIPDYQEINMTKDKGAGTLAHEWWHAVDNYFGYTAEGKDYSLSFGTDIKEQGNLRKEVFNAFKDLMKNIKEIPLTPEEIETRKNAIIERSERNIKYYAQLVKDTFKNVNGVEEFVDNIVNNKEKYVNLTPEERHNIEWNDFGELIPERRKTISNMAKMNWLLSEIERIGRAEELANRGTGKTEYYKSAEKLNDIEKMGGKGYWTEPTELGARAFTTWLLDKMETQQIVNRFLARSQAGEVSLDFNELFKELKSGEEKNSLVYWNPKNPEEKARIFKAFDDLFNTIKTRETDKGIELYSDFGVGKKSNNNIDIEKHINDAIDNGVKISDVIDSPIFDGMRDVAGQIQDYVMGKMPSGVYPDTTLGSHLNGKKAILINNDVINSIDDEKLRGLVFKNTLRHEIEHALQEKETNRIKDIYNLSDDDFGTIKKLFKDIYNHEKHPQQEVQNIIKNLNNKKINKLLSDKGLNGQEIQHVKDYIECEVVNKRRQDYINKYNDEIDKFNEETKDLSEEEYNKKVKANKIIDGFFKVDYDYRNCNFEKFSNNEANKLTGDISYATGQIFKGKHVGISQNDEQFGSQTGTQFELHKTTSKETKYFGQEIGPLRDTETAKTPNRQDEIKIEKATRDSLYQWYGEVEKARFDVDKDLNDFNQITKSTAKDFSKKTGLKVSDKMIREVLPFLRERTEVPEELGRKDLYDFYNKLSQEDITRLTKLADNVCAKFDKYWQNYKDAKGILTEEDIENHISHLWNVGKKQKGVLTNYFNTNSRFAKPRTIESLVQGIKQGYEPRTLDIGEILKIQSDSLIKAANDSILAETLKKMRYNKEILVQPSHKAPSDWVEIDHPALNKAVYAGSTDNGIILSRRSVKVHPAVADIIAPVFEVQKADRDGLFSWKVYDNINGTLKQIQLGFSGFHGYALTESSIGNSYLKDTLKHLNPKEFVDAIKNGNYDIFKQEAAAKDGIEHGLKLGTPSDLNRSNVEKFLSHIPIVGKLTEANNKILWDCLHNSFKIEAYKMKCAEIGENITTEQKRSIAQWVNDSFGGQAWELLGVKNSTVKTLSRGLLSPDWLISTTRQFMGMGENVPMSKWVENSDIKALRKFAKLSGVADIGDAVGVRGKSARKFWITAIALSLVFYNLINAMFRAKDRKEHPEYYSDNSLMSYTIWDNALPGDKLSTKIMPYIFIGRNKDGSARYLRLGKQFREVPEMISEPVSKLSMKSATVPSAIANVGLGYSIGDVPKKLSGKDNEVYYNQDIWNGYGKFAKKKQGFELVKGRVKTAAKSVAPFVVNNALNEKHNMSAWDMFAQTSNGMGYTKAKNQYLYVYEHGNKQKDFEKITKKGLQDGMSYKQLRSAQKKAETEYAQDLVDKYSIQYVNALKEQNQSKINKVADKLEKENVPAKIRVKVYKSALKEYRKSVK